MDGQRSNLSKVEAVSWDKVSGRLQPTMDFPDLIGGEINVCICACVRILRRESPTLAPYDFVCN